MENELKKELDRIRKLDKKAFENWRKRENELQSTIDSLRDQLFKEKYCNKFNWQPIESAPKDDTLILGLCIHKENAYFYKDGEKLTTYGAHCEGLAHVIDGPHVLEWGGSWQEDDGYIDNWWFLHGSNFEEVANPVCWTPIPKITLSDEESYIERCPKCNHTVITKWSGIECTNCNYQFCF